MNRYEIDYYDDVSKIKETLKRIAEALEAGNVTKAKEISGENTGLLSAKAILDSVKVITDDYASKKDIPLTITNSDLQLKDEEVGHPVDKLQGNDIPGFEGTLDALDNLTNKELHEGKLHTDDGYQDDDIVHNDYLTDLVQEMNKEQYIEFCQEMSYVNYDLKVVQHSIDELEYKECLGAIKQALAIIGDDADDPNLEVQMNQDESFEDYHANLSKLNNDPYTYEHEFDKKGDNSVVKYHCGVINDSDYQIRETAYGYEAALESEAQYTSKKDCIFDYVTNEFGMHGARYTDIIKFAYYLGSPNAPKYSNVNRGYYSCGFAMRYGGHLITGGKDQLVKGINKDGDERYFALSYVESATDYWKRLDE